MMKYITVYRLPLKDINNGFSVLLYNSIIIMEGEEEEVQRGPIIIQRDEEEFVENIYQPILLAPVGDENLALDDFVTLVENPAVSVMPPLQNKQIDIVANVEHPVDITPDKTFMSVPHLEWISDRRNASVNPHPPIFTAYPGWNQVFRHLISSNYAMVEGECGSGKTTAAWYYFLFTALKEANLDKVCVWISLNLGRKITIYNGVALVERFDPYGQGKKSDFINTKPVDSVDYPHKKKEKYKAKSADR